LGFFFTFLRGRQTVTQIERWFLFY
jgi:hypothetical protein